MAESTVKQNGILWLDKTGLSLYLENKPFIRLNFTPDIVNNLEIVDKLKLENLLHNFISQNNFGSISFILIMTSDILFEKDWTIPQTEVQKKEESDFIDSIPFENIITHSWIKDNKKKLIAANQDFIYFIKDVFEKYNGRSVAAFPYSLFGANVRNESVKEIWKNLNTLKQDNLIDVNSSPLPVKSNNTELQKSGKKSTMLPLLIGVFVVLIGVLGFLMLRK